jgi:hypothetical protein
MLFVGLGCDELVPREAPEAPRWDAARRPSDATDEAAARPRPTGQPIEPRGPIERARLELPFPARASTTFGFNLEALSTLRALAGEVEVPPWAAASDDDPALARDDDLSTAWRCTPTTDAPCALGLGLPRSTRLKALRIHAAPRAKDRPGRRPSKIRIHTDEGFVDVPLPDDPTHLHIVLGQAVPTRNIALEVLEHRGGEGPLRLAELEAYGVDGEPREPWDIDPLQTIVRLPEDPWAPTAGGWVLRSGTIEVLAPNGTLRELMDGTALVGRRGDRMLLLERIDRTTCDRHGGTFFLVDQHTRVVAPLGSLGGAGADVYRHAQGLGFAVGHHSEASTVLHGIVLEGRRYRRTRTPARRDRRAPDLLAKWGLDPEPLGRGGMLPPALPSGCVLGSDDLMVRLTNALGRKKPEARPGQWVICDLGDDAKAYLTARAPCGDRTELHVVDPTGQVRSHEAKGEGTHLRLERVAPDEVLAEIGRSNGASEVFRVRPEGISGLGKGTSLALRPPPGCRKACDDALASPHERSH